MPLPKETYRVYNEDGYEVVITGKRAVVHDKQSGRYYESNSCDLPVDIVRSTQERNAVFSANTSLLCTISMIVLLGVNMAVSLHTVPMLTPRFFLWFVPYMIVSVVIHEGAHLVALRICGRRADKVGVKMNYLIFPAFYVRMNQTLLLPLPDKVVVHVAGIWANLVLNVFLWMLNWAWIRSPDLEYSIVFAVVALSMNALPVLNSDGYRCLLAWMDVNEHAEVWRNPRWVVVLKVLSWMAVAACGARFLAATLRGTN